MTIRVSCPNPDCGAVANVEEQSLGRRGRCKKCGHVFALVRPGGEPASAISGDASAWKGTSPARPTASPINLPEQFGRYRIMKPLGQGGMGAVYLAHDTKLNRSVALKVPYFSPADGPQAVQRFEREARAAATLDHPNLCPIFDVGEIDGIPYLTMPYIEGKPLSEALNPDQTVSELQAAAVIRKLALALQEAHEKGIIHRDLKPSNIMINRRRELIIMDFGLARMCGGDEGALTKTGHVLGTALYMAPEQAAGENNAIGPASDVYSLGVILYELLTGQRPFEGPWSLVIGLKNVMDPPPPSKHRPDLSPALDAIGLKAIAKDPKDRYASMAEFADALNALLILAPAPESVRTPDGTSHPVDNSESLARQAFGGIPSQNVTSFPEEKSPGLPERARPDGKARPFRNRTTILAGSGVVALLFLGIVISLTRPGSSSNSPFAKLPFEKDLFSWTQFGKGSFQVSDDGELTMISPGNDPADIAMLRTNREDFRNFRLQIEILNADDIRKGIVIRSTHTDDTKSGYVISIGGTKSPWDEQFEPIGSIQVLRDVPRDSALKVWAVVAKAVPVPVGQWQLVEITAINNRITTSVGGQIVGEFVDDQPGREMGSIWLICYKTLGKFRNFSIQELSALGEPVTSVGPK